MCLLVGCGCLMEVETLMKKSGCSTVRAASVATVMKRIGGSEAA
jgi:hypothetical protein